MAENQAQHTPGPWFWDLNLKHKQVRLSSVRNGVATVLDFGRWGMGGATVRFCVKGLMHDAKELAQIVPNREHHADWFQNINHPDARLIAAAPDLLAYAKCEEAMWSSSDPTESIAVLKLHGYDEAKYTCPADFLDELRKAAIAKATTP